MVEASSSRATRTGRGLGRSRLGGAPPRDRHASPRRGLQWATAAAPCRDSPACRSTLQAGVSTAAATFVFHTTTATPARTPSGSKGRHREQVAAQLRDRARRAPGARADGALGEGEAAVLRRARACDAGEGTTEVPKELQELAARIERSTGVAAQGRPGHYRR